MSPSGGGATAASEQAELAAVREGHHVRIATGCGPISSTSTRGRARCRRMADLMAKGVKGQNGLLQGIPAEHGCRLVHARDGDVAGRARLDEQHVLPAGRLELQQPDELLRDRSSCRPTRSPQAAERAGKKVVAARVGRRAQLRPALQGPVGRLPNFFSTRGVLAFPLVPAEQAGAAAFGISYQVAAFATASGWTNAPAGRSGCAAAADDPHGRHDVRGAEPDSHLRRLHLRQRRQRRSAAYDHVDPRPQRRREGRRASRAAEPRGGRLGRRQAHGRRRPDRRARGPDRRLLREARSRRRRRGSVSSFKLYFTSVERVNATCNALGAARLGRTSRRRSPTTSRRRRPRTSRRSRRGIVDEDTYVEQGLIWKNAHFAYLKYILDDLGSRTPTCCCVGDPDHGRVLAPVHGARTRRRTSTATPNPYFDDADERRRPRRTRSRSARGTSAAPTTRPTTKLALARELMGGNPTTFVVLGPRLRAAVVRGERAARCSPTPGSRPPRADRRNCRAGARPTQPRQGVLGRRHGPDLRQHDAAGRHDVRAGPEQRSSPPSRT